MAQIEPLDRDHVPRPEQNRGRYPWERWLIPGQKVTCRQRTDFPDTKPESFRSAAYAAARRMKPPPVITVSLSRDGAESIAVIRTYPGART